MYEVIWHGRGGQGVVVAAQILAEAAYIEGYKGVTSAPTFGPERRGAPLTASTKISREPIRTFAQIETADTVVVLDMSLMKVVDVLSTLKTGGFIILNTPSPAEELDMPGCFNIAAVNASAIALSHHLIKEDAPLVNTPLLGAFAKVTALVSLKSIETILKKKLSGSVATENILTLRDAFEKTSVKLAL
jgi:2-oxoacid:acceptor oxidoreductase gamma subunit (pyruvate/2-ketoisovalerate family)